MEWLKRVIEGSIFTNIVIGVVVLNSITIGLETDEYMTENFGHILHIADKAALTFFCAEILVKLIVYRHRFFAFPWNVFDFVIVGIALAPVGDGLSVLRAFRIFRALKLVSSIPTMRKVVHALLSAVPAMASVMGLLAIVFYISAVMATNLFGADFPEWFGSIGASSYSLFQIMTLESWSMGIGRPVMEVFPYAWMFFVPFILTASFVVINLFIAIICNSMAECSDDVEKSELSKLTEEIRQLKELMQGAKS